MQGLSRDAVQEHARGILSDPRKAVNALMVAIHVFAFCFVICALAVTGDSVSKSYNFAAVFLALQIVVFSLYATYSLQKRRTHFDYGLLVGITGCQSIQMLTLAVLSAGNVASLSLSDAVSSPSSEKAIVAFGIFLFLLYGILSAVLTIYRDALAPGGTGHERLVDAATPAPDADAGESEGAFALSSPVRAGDAGSDAGDGGDAEGDTRL